MIESGVVKPPIGATYELEDFGRALAGHGRAPHARQVGRAGAVTLPASTRPIVRRGTGSGSTGARRAPRRSPTGADRRRSCVDVLSFTTTLTVGGRARRHGRVAVPLGGRAGGGVRRRARRRAGRRPVSRHARDRRRQRCSLSPADRGPRDRRRAARAAVAQRLARSALVLRRAAASPCVGACLRNDAVGGGQRHLADAGRSRSWPAGERWPDGSLRPCAEDLWGAGAVSPRWSSSGLAGLSPRRRSPRRRSGPSRVTDLTPALADCASGLELAGTRLRRRVSVSR